MFAFILSSYFIQVSKKEIREQEVEFINLSKVSSVLCYLSTTLNDDNRFSEEE